jgi:hypothetical protein
MKATSIKQIKFNRGQVSDLLSERVDMGLQNACGTVYENVYINRYGQIKTSPSLLLAGDTMIPNYGSVICMFDTGGDKVYVITLEGVGSNVINVYGPLSKSNPYQKVDFSNILQTATLTQTGKIATKAYQFGYNVVFYGDNCKPWLLNLLPVGEWTAVMLTVKEDYFDNAFDNIYIRGINTEPPTGFTPPTSGMYIIRAQAVTSTQLVDVERNGAGDAFTQDLVGQVLLCKQNGGALQVRAVHDADKFTASVLSPLHGSVESTFIGIPFGSGLGSEWLFGYERAYGDTGTPSYPDSVIYANQRLIFGGNDYHGSLISASRIGVINDFDPETATESDAFTTSIASKDFCRIVDFVVSNNELRIACTNGEYAINLANLTPTGSLNGFDLRSEVGVAKDTAICDCGGLTAYVSNDRNAVYGTQFNLLKDRYQPISLTSQTSNIVNNCTDLKYLTNRPNNEGNCLVGLNSDGTMFVAGLDLNAGLVGLSKMSNLPVFFKVTPSPFWVEPDKLFATGSALWVQYKTRTAFFLTRFAFNEIFDFPVWYNALTQSVVIPGIVELLGFRYPTGKTFRALYHNVTTDQYEFIAPTGITPNGDGTYTLIFADNIVQENIIVAGFVRQADWRSVEIGVGMATREINKRIVKLEGVIEPTQVTGQGRYAGLTLTPEQAKNFITLTRSKEVQEMDVDNLSNTSYTESADVVWRRAFDNPDRCLHYGISAICPFLLKSITCVIEYDEAA